jgi:hypothetical protein
VPGKKIHVQASTVSSAQSDEIYALLVNSATYPLWSMIRYYESLRPGRNGLHDVGALRLFRTNAITVMREEVTDVAQDKRVAYKLLSGFPLLEYRAQTTLEKVPSGSGRRPRASLEDLDPRSGENLPVEARAAARLKGIKRNAFTTKAASVITVPHDCP